jgi:myo-inositol-1(or 4)-monophosphatase
MGEINLNQAKELAVKVAVKVGKLLLDNIDNISEVKQKGKRDLVTNLDIEAEKIIIDAIEKEYPLHSIIAEESGVTHKGSEYTWVVDPIDGTMNFIHGNSPFRVAIGLLHKEESVLSVLYGPTNNRLAVAVKGQGAMINDKKIEVSKHNDLLESLVMTHLSSKKLPRLRTIVALENIFNNAMQIRVLGSGLAAMEYISSSKFDVFFNVETKIWDILPAVCLIEEAGGKVTDIEGNKITMESKSVLVTNGRVHDQMLELLKNI